MSYVVMARKWRPRNFEEMVGQEHIAQTIRNAIDGNRIAHAYLFTGTRGVGKTTSARILAKALNCKKGPTATPCETCENCVAVNQGNSMDVLEIDGASNNGVDNVRELREQVKYAPMQGTYKVYIIDEVHMLTKAAFNALLKTLEEPPPHVVFIFATTEANKVPHTILSRVQRFDFKRISESAIRERLAFICGKEGVTPESEALEVIARKADGSMRDALSLFDRVYAFSGSALTLEAAQKVLGIPDDSLFDALLGRLAAHDTAGSFATLDEVCRQGLEISEFLLGFGEYLRDLLFSRQEGMTASLLGHSERRFQELRNLVGDLQDGDILRYAKIISDLLTGIRTAAHPRLWVELGLARLAALDRVVTLSQLLGQETNSAAALKIDDGKKTDDGKKKSPELTPRLPPATAVSPPPSTQATAVVVTPPSVENHPVAPSPSENPVEEKDVESISLTSIPRRWKDWVETYAEARPLTASALRHSRLRVETGEPATLDVAFDNRHQRDLFLADPDNKRNLRNFIAEHIAKHLAEPSGEKTPFTLNFSAPEASADSGSESAAPPMDSLEALARREPIIPTLLEMFEGRILDIST